MKKSSIDMHHTKTLQTNCKVKYSPACDWFAWKGCYTALYIVYVALCMQNMTHGFCSFYLC